MIGLTRNDFSLEDFLSFLEHNGWEVIAGDAPLDYPNIDEIREEWDEWIADRGFMGDY